MSWIYRKWSWRYLGVGPHLKKNDNIKIIHDGKKISVLYQLDIY